MNMNTMAQAEHGEVRAKEKGRRNMLVGEVQVEVVATTIIRIRQTENPMGAQRSERGMRGIANYMHVL